MAAKVGGGWCGFTDNSCQLVDFMSFDKPFDVSLLKRYPSNIHHSTYPFEETVGDDYKLFQKIAKVYAKLRVEGSFAKVTLEIPPQ